MSMSMPFALHMHLKSKADSSKLIVIAVHLHRPRDAQLPDLTKHILYPCVEIAAGILVACRSIEVLLHLRHAAVRFRAEA